MGRFKLDEIDHQILDMLIENTRTPFTDIAKKLDISAGTVHVRVRKMEETGLIKGSTLTVDYDRLGYTFVSYIGIYLEKNHQTQFVLERLEKIPYVTVAHVTTGKYNLFCKIRTKDPKHTKEVIYMIDEIEGVARTESMISLEEVINDKRRLMHAVFKEL
ncbi:Lrp/AsnC family transcriptional regulator [Capnocytophaga canis]|uniref:Lrp/AsnC family transcriptional regulator n=1 Tax=Capnocytophaga canis TaxID=1848903 RepID=UPI0015624E10|nr:winged helix-turn-helix transcriptional regulator [Capnocytophaga canis]